MKEIEEQMTPGYLVKAVLASAKKQTNSEYKWGIPRRRSHPGAVGERSRHRVKVRDAQLGEAGDVNEQKAPKHRT